MKKLLKKWFKLYTEADLVSFGKYLLSEQRERALKVWTDMDPDAAITYEDKKRDVFDGDLDFWKDADK